MSTSLYRGWTKSTYRSLSAQRLSERTLLNSLKRGGAVGWGSALQAGKSQARFPMVSLEFFIGMILPAA
jgi:hypothetical protein